MFCRAAIELSSAYLIPCINGYRTPVPSLLQVPSRNCFPACSAFVHSSGVDLKVPVNG